jgi:integrase
MKCQYRLFRRNNGIYFVQNNRTKKQESLRTRNKTDAQRLFNARNEAHQQPAINLQIARAYLMASDPMIVQRTWQHVMDEIVKTKHGPTLERWQSAVKDHAFDSIRSVPLVETQAEQLLRALENGTVSTNVHLRKLHNFALDMNWLPWAVVPKKQWPPIIFKAKRAITWDEHCRIVEREKNPERKAFYQLAWHLGASQTDLASLLAKNVDWDTNILSFNRRKTGSHVAIHLGEAALNIFKDLPSEGQLFPYLAHVRSGDRATEFKQRCDGLDIKGVTLHSYRYAWAERAKVAGYPERFAQESLGHNSATYSRAYSKNGQVTLPSLEEYEKKMAMQAVK